MTPYQDFKEMLGVNEITFNQFNKDKHSVAVVKGISIIVAKNFDAKKPAYVKKGLTDVNGNMLNADAYLLFNAKDAIASFTL